MDVWLSRLPSTSGTTPLLLGVPLALTMTAVAIALTPSPSLKMDTVVIPAAKAYMSECMGIADDTTLSDHPLKGLVVAITGPTGGIGLGLTRRLVQLGATVIAIGRSMSKLKSLQQECPEQIEIVQADLTDFESVSKAGKEMLQKFDHIDILVNNAGIHTLGDGLFAKLSNPQGYDLSFSVNFMSHFLLTELLLPLLQKSKYPKVVHVSSRFHYSVDGSDLGTRGGSQPPIASVPGGSHGFVVFRAQRQYANTKMAQIVHAHALQSGKFTPQPIHSVSICPTWVGTQIGAKEGSLSHRMFTLTAFDSNGFGLSSLLHAILDTKSLAECRKDRKDFYINSNFGLIPSWSFNIFNYLPGWTYSILPIRDMLANTWAFTLVYFTQKLLTTRVACQSASVAYDETLQEELYQWTRAAVSKYL
eukprot:Nitzschia sp. Nitz4//scaffold78_size91513//72378//73702//NITZ4_004935-RA/size91513-snap-gene-0.127-mRNA-1//1//CDS//3329558148//2519//frame0